MMNFKPKTVSVKDLLLDPNNYRFLDDPDFKARVTSRLHEDSVQQWTLRALERGREYQLDSLRNSILTNGYIPFEKIVVVPYKHKSGNYLVIEGNRRVAALKSILRDADEGVITLSTEQRKAFSSVAAAELLATSTSVKDAARIIMGIRHIAGPKEWGAYQQARLVLEFVEQEGKELKEIAHILGITAVEAARRFRAMKALKAMETDELYADASEPGFYRLFHELVSLPKVRERFGWNQDSMTFTDTNEARAFYELIAPHGEKTEPKIKTFLDVRKLKDIVGNPTAEASLLDPDQPLTDALEKAAAQKRSLKPETLSEEISRFESVLTRVGIDEIRDLTEGLVGQLEGLIALIQQRVDDFRRLTK